MSERGPLSRDFDRLEAGAGLVTGGRTITEADLVSFSALTGDWHPQHSDAAWAAESRFGERIAHGMMVISYAIGLLPIDPERVIALRGLRQVVFKRPVPIGETIHAHAEVAERKPLDEGHGLVTLSVQVRDPDGRLLARLVIDALWRRGAPEDVAAGNGSADGVAGASGGGLDAASTSVNRGELSPVDGGRVLI